MNPSRRSLLLAMGAAALVPARALAFFQRWLQGGPY